MKNSLSCSSDTSMALPRGSSLNWKTYLKNNYFDTDSFLIFWE